MKNNLFRPIVFLSAAAHMGILAGSGNFFSAPEFAVRRAPSSVDVQLIEEPEPQTEPETVLEAEPGPPKEEAQKPERAVVDRGVISEPKPAEFSNPAPVYPAIARTRAWEGRVIVKVFVRTDGTAGEVLVEQSSGYGVLDRAAVEAIRLWRFIPAKAGGVSFESSVLIPVRFSLED